MGLKVSFEVENVFHEKRIGQIKKNKELSVQIENPIEHKTLKLEAAEKRELIL